MKSFPASEADSKSGAITVPSGMILISSFTELWIFIKKSGSVSAILRVPISDCGVWRRSVSC